MANLKEAAEAIAIATEKLQTLRDWASISYARTILVILGVGLFFLVTQYATFNYLLTETKKQSQTLVRDAEAIGKELRYKVALDAINVCLESGKEIPKLRKWYCENATAQYKNVSKHAPPERVKGVVDRLAYAAMRDDVSHYVRSHALERLIQTPATPEQVLLNNLLSTTVTVSYVLVFAFVLVSAYVVLRILPRRRMPAPMHSRVFFATLRKRNARRA